ncbi:hypothetical protein [Anaerococcus vaginalis]|uniref:hypothetical protein n=1 Tax=Anaerococcus vaginalis TaxID=33037 RepID=UPI0029104C43|nr:hypothetical protein [Anaerococcus vaginalis]MDU5342083.1 hypothetical protein [Anaerococcus vaginalis]
MNSKENYRQYIHVLPCAASLVLLIQYLAFFYIYKNSQQESLKRSLIYSLGFLIFSIFLAKVQKVNFDLKNIKYKKLTIILLLVFIVLNIINTI